MNVILAVTNAIALLIFGLILSFAFSGVKATKYSFIGALSLFVFCGILQGAVYLSSGEKTVWYVYPIIAHLPIIFYIRLAFKKRLYTAVFSVFTAYLMCQPARWMKFIIGHYSDNVILNQAVYVIALSVMVVISVKFLSICLAKQFNDTFIASCLFGIVPTIFYLFDYFVIVFPNIWKNNLLVASEFLAFFICIVFIMFCIVYYRENEKKSDAERKENIIRITVEQQARELEAIKRSENELRILRHDLRLFLSSLSACINQDEKSVARELIASYSKLIEDTRVERFCTFDSINYILSDFSAKCKNDKVNFVNKIELTEIKSEEILLASILSNALDNALNAQKHLPEEKRFVQLVLRNSDGKILISVKNPYKKEPLFINGLPVTSEEGHGTGVRSICYMTERLGGNYQFSTKDGLFITRVII